MPLPSQMRNVPTFSWVKRKWNLHEETFASIVEKKNLIVSKQKKTKMVLAVATHATETLKMVSKKKVMVHEETTMWRSPRMKAKIPKVSIET